MKISTKYFIKIILVLFVFSGLSISMEGQSVSEINRAVEIKKVNKLQLINFKDIIYTATITSHYNQAGNAIKRGVYLHYYKGDWSEPETWLINVIKLYFNGVEITKKNKPNYFFDSQVSSLSSNLDVVIKHQTNTYSADVFSASGTDTPVSMTFPTQGYVYNLVKRLKGKQINSLNIKKIGLKVAWTSTTDDILVWLYHNGSVIKQLSPSPGMDYVRFKQSLFQPGENYTIRIRQNGPGLTLAGKFKSGSYIRTNYLIWCNIKTK